MKTAIRLSLAALLVLGTTGCVYIDGERVGHDDWREEQRINSEMISQLEMGMGRNTVVGKLGTPADSEAFDSNGAEMRVLFYRTRHRHSDGVTTRDETTPLVFENDVLIGWGQGVYDNLRS